MKLHNARIAGGRWRKRSRFAEDLSDFLGWWGTTLAGMLPRGLVGAFSTRRDPLYLRQKDGDFLAGRGDAAGFSSISDDKKLRRRAAASDPVLLLEPQDVLVRQRRMPVASLSRLSHAMQLQITAETPFELGEIYTDTRTIGAPDEDGNILVEQAIVKRDLAEERLDALRHLEIDLAGADIVGETGAPAGFNLLPAEKCARQGAFLPTVNRVLSFAALALGVALAASWYIDLSRQASQLERAAAETGTIAREVLGLQAQAQSGIAAIEQIETANADPGRFAAAYAAITEALDDNSWLEGLTYTGNTVSLTGLTRKSDTLISSLEASPQIASARFTASVVTDRRHDAERFRVELVLKSDAASAAVASMEDRG